MKKWTASRGGGDGLEKNRLKRGPKKSPPHGVGQKIFKISTRISKYIDIAGGGGVQKI